MEFTNTYETQEQAEYAAEYFSAKGFSVIVSGLKVVAEAA